MEKPFDPAKSLVRFYHLNGLLMGLMYALPWQTGHWGFWVTMTLVVIVLCFYGRESDRLDVIQRYVDGENV